MRVNVAPSSSTNSQAVFPVNRSSNIAILLPNPFILHCKKTKGSIFSRRKVRAITTGSRIVGAHVDMKEAEKKRGGEVRIVSIVGEASVSPLKSAPWLDVMLHTVYTDE
ncbi:uncharacterized protein LOC132615964 [Lycium barbarum]|uniref:uncharacterized protein LOC132615964 n=1 Tax=Lycium barbarum TaxID=112863 RepID=UPI00293F2CBE|nr:uncharacterized protein LOC132615964 [Lycium barbarum]